MFKTGKPRKDTEIFKLCSSFFGDQFLTTTYLVHRSPNNVCHCGSRDWICFHLPFIMRQV